MEPRGDDPVANAQIVVVKDVTAVLMPGAGPQVGVGCAHPVMAALRQLLIRRAETRGWWAWHRRRETSCQFGLTQQALSG